MAFNACASISQSLPTLSNMKSDCNNPVSQVVNLPQLNESLESVRCAGNQYAVDLVKNNASGNPTSVVINPSATPVYSDSQGNKPGQYIVDPDKGKVVNFDIIGGKVENVNITPLQGRRTNRLRISSEEKAEWDTLSKEERQARIFENSEQQINAQTANSLRRVVIFAIAA